MLIGYKYRIYPNKAQRNFINKQIGASRFMWNMLLTTRLNIYEKAKEKEEKLGIKIKVKYPNYSAFKNKYEWLNSIDSNALAYEKLHLNRAFENYYKNYDPKDPSKGFPKHKKRYKKKTYTTAGKGIKVIEDKYIILPLFKRYNLPPMKIVLHRPFYGRIVQGTISITASNKYYISLICEDEDKYDFLEKTGSMIAIDLGIKDYLTFSKSDGTTGKIENPKNYKKLEAREKFYNRERSRKKLYSKNWIKDNIKINKTREKEKYIRKDFLDKLSNKIIQENDVIVIEDIKVQEIMEKNKKEATCNKQRQNLNKAQQDAGWYMFRSMLEYKTLKAGRTLIIADENFKSTELCSNCGYENDKLKDVKIRKWTCPQCGEVHDRDINASYNLLQYGKDYLDGKVVVND